MIRLFFLCIVQCSNYDIDSVESRTERYTIETSLTLLLFSLFFFDFLQYFLLFFFALLRVSHTHTHAVTTTTTTTTKKKKKRRRRRDAPSFAIDGGGGIETKTGVGWEGGG